MIDPFFKFFERDRSNISQNLYGQDDDFKSYPDLPFFPLPENNLDNPSELFKLLENRKSAEVYKDQALPIETLSKVLRFSVGLKKNNPKRRMYPSGGGKYPTEIYLAALNVQDLEKGLYHYNVESHGLTKVNNLTREDVNQCFPINHSNYPVFSAPLLLFMTFSKNRSIPKYGSLAYKLGLIEAGHIGQNIYLTAGVFEIGCRAHAGGDLEKVHQLLNIDGIGECLIYTYSIGFSK
jgi:SagB-type dehydrogenase family enzyme